MSNNMLDILSNFDSAAKGEKPAAPAEVGSMKAILESIQAVEECGDMPMEMPTPMEPEDKMSMNVTLSARGDAVEELIALMGKAKAPQDAPVKLPMPMPAAGPKGGEPDMAKLIAMTADDQDMDEEWDNAPEEEYSDHEYMTKDLSGGINREKKAYKATQDGDNPMAVDESDELTASLRESLKGQLAEKFNSLKK